MNDSSIGFGLTTQKTNPNMRFDLRDRIVVGEKSTEFDTYRQNQNENFQMVLDRNYTNMQLYKCIQDNRRCSLLCVALLIVLISLILFMCVRNNTN